MLGMNQNGCPAARPGISATRAIGVYDYFGHAAKDEIIFGVAETNSRRRSALKVRTEVGSRNLRA